ncbi:M15 family peptidase [Aestuariibacter halophilus]|uniref:M15 family peptidase n=1 Tax=Fluctibacter halophilus TaxID=226011 RepID=A0ABS8G6C0_9ALTE|nr:M15 family peptidase [Aestuariibacter halophilus]MCC2615948.1 M15 family peptidase [Aestuariibacter halophilus]
MPSYSRTSRDRLATCHEDLQLIFNELIGMVDHSILCGHRGKEEQNQAYAENKSRVKWPDGKHNEYPSLAVDAAPYFIELGNVDWNDLIALACFAGQVIMMARRLYDEGEISHLVRWGGDWDRDGRNADQEFNDFVHFELIKPTW